MKALIFIVETRASCESDWMYIKGAIDYFYEQRTARICKIFANCKSKLITQDKKIASTINNYGEDSHVIICADYDRNEPLNNTIMSYCNNKNYDIIWMNLDVEHVFWGTKVPDNKKKSEAIKFQKKKDTILSKLSNLDSSNPLNNAPQSNLLSILDNYLKRK